MWPTQPKGRAPCTTQLFCIRPGRPSIPRLMIAQSWTDRLWFGVARTPHGLSLATLFNVFDGTVTVSCGVVQVFHFLFHDLSLRRQTHLCFFSTFVWRPRFSQRQSPSPCHFSNKVIVFRAAPFFHAANSDVHLVVVLGLSFRANVWQLQLPPFHLCSPFHVSLQHLLATFICFLDIFLSPRNGPTQLANSCPTCASFLSVQEIMVLVMQNGALLCASSDSSARLSRIKSQVRIRVRECIVPDM